MRKRIKDQLSYSSFFIDLYIIDPLNFFCFLCFLKLYFTLTAEVPTRKMKIFRWYIKSYISLKRWSLFNTKTQRIDFYSPKYNFHGCTRTPLARRFSAFSSRSFLRPHHYHNQTHRRTTTSLECTFHCCICNIKNSTRDETHWSKFLTQQRFNAFMKKWVQKGKNLSQLTCIHQPCSCEMVGWDSYPRRSSRRSRRCHRSGKFPWRSAERSIEIRHPDTPAAESLIKHTSKEAIFEN